MADLTPLVESFFKALKGGNIAQARNIANSMQNPRERQMALDHVQEYIMSGGKKDKKDKKPVKARLAGEVGSFSEMLDKVGSKAPKLKAVVDQFDEIGASITTLAATSRARTGGLIADMTNYQRRNAALGITTEDTFAALTSTLTGYAKVSGPAFAKNAVANTKQVSMYKKLGVDAGTTIGVFNKFEGVLGKTREASIKTSQVLNKFAQTSGQSYSRVWQDFSTNVTQFMDILDSEQMTRQTLLFQTRARRMGLSVGEIMTPLQQFETLDSAQASAGKINAVMASLGGSFDAIKAASMDFPDRMEYISKSIQGVMGRVQSSGPRASRAYTVALRKAFGLSATQFRAMASYKPGAASVGEQMMAQGDMRGLTGRETEAAVSAAARREDITNALKDARESFLYIALPKAMGIVSTNFMDAIVKKTAAADQALYNIGEKVAGGVVGKITDGLLEAFKTGDLKAMSRAMGGIAGSMDKMRKCVTGTPGNADCKAIR